MRRPTPCTRSVISETGSPPSVVYSSVMIDVPRMGGMFAGIELSVGGWESVATQLPTELNSAARYRNM